MHTYTCETETLFADLTNVATVSADGVAPRSDSAFVDVFTTVEISKQPDEQEVATGGTATFSMVVRNNGPEILTQVQVADAAAPNCSRVLADLNPEDVFQYNCTTGPLLDDLTNVATVTALDGGGNLVTDSDSAFVKVFPDVEISKTPDIQQVNPGQKATFAITIRNVSGSTLSNIVVEDPLTPDCIRGILGESGTIETIPDLGAGAAHTYTCDTEALFADLTNLATVSADGVAPRSDSAFVDVFTPVEISKEPDEQEVNSGQTFTFSIVVKNNTDQSLTQIQVSDPLAPNCSRELDDLNPEDFVRYECVSGPLFADLTNVATVVALDGGDNLVTDSDSAFVKVFPDITISKVPDTQQVIPGQKATFTITVENLGGSTLTNIVVQDPLTTDCVRGILGEVSIIDTIPDLGPGEAHSFVCETEALFADLTNVATVSADGVSPQSDSAFVDVFTTVEISKEPDEQEVVSGQSANFSILVRNNSAQTLTQIQVDDPSAPNCSRSLADLPPKIFSATTAPVVQC